jgi:hypothetical protein
MSTIRAIILALLVSFSSLFAGCDDDEKTEDDPQAGGEVECVVTEEEDCMEDPAGEEMPAGEAVEAGEEPVVEMDMDLPVEAGEMTDEMDMEIPVEAGEEMPAAGEEVDPVPEAGEESPSEAGVEESTEEAPAGEEGEPVDPAPQAGEPG